VPQGMKVSQIVAFIEYNHGKSIYGTVWFSRQPQSNPHGYAHKAWPWWIL
jgi:hypothetical protein